MLPYIFADEKTFLSKSQQPQKNSTENALKREIDLQCGIIYLTTNWKIKSLQKYPLGQKS